MKRAAVSPQMKELFNLAMKEWEDYTCISFQRKDSAERLTFLKYRTDHEGCYSFVGRQAKGKAALLFAAAAVLAACYHPERLA